MAIILGYVAKQLYALYICAKLYKQYAIDYSGIDLSCYMIINVKSFWQVLISPKVCC